MKEASGQSCAVPGPSDDERLAQIRVLRQQADRMMRSHGIHRLAGNNSPPYFTGYACGRLYGWDQYFEAIIQQHLGWDTTYIRNSLILLLDAIERDGFIPRSLPPVWWARFHAQPFLAQQAVLLLRAGDDLSWMRWRYFYSLKHYLFHWLYDRDVRGEGLSVWDHAGHSGMDNHVERAGHFYDAYCEGVDLNAYLVRECDAMEVIAHHLGCRPTAARMHEAGCRRREAINRWCWNDDAGMYMDFHAREGRPIPVKYVGAFAPLWAGVAVPQQAHRLVTEHLRNEKEFARPWPIPALAADEPGYVEGAMPDEEVPDCSSWRAHTWMPTNYYVTHGLARYGFAEDARHLARHTADLFCREPFREYYASESGRGWGRQPFWGWSGLALFLEDEIDAGQDRTRLEATPEPRIDSTTP